MIKILGAMTGTSCDGLDAACIEIDENGWKLLWSQTAPYPGPLRKRVLKMQLPGEKRTMKEILEVERDLGEWYGKTFAKMIARAPAGTRPDVIANHGQTVAHYPASGRKGVTLQMGDPTRIAAATGLTVVSQFRDGDMSAGGEGAPLAPLFHRALARALGGGGVAVHNLGGISNLTYVAPDGNVIAFDTGPANVWIDAATELATRGSAKFDRGGARGARGKVDQAAVRKILAHPFFKKAPPKSTGRDDFPFAILRKNTRVRGDDLVATATAVTIESVVRAYQNFILKKGLPLSTIYLSGGGARNQTLLKELGSRLGVTVTTLQDAGVDPQLTEALAFAYFGYLSLRGKPLGGTWTGAKSFGAPGQITPGENWNALVSKLCL
jgi:anhydro-N-acetylmuramic acid kinase